MIPADSKLRPLSLVRPLALSLLLLPLLTGCGFEALAGTVVETETREFSRSFPLGEGEILRLANLAGEVELVPGSGSEVVVRTTVHASGKNDSETRGLLQGMEWEEGKSKSGKAQWHLTYPVERHRSFHYNGDGWGQSTVRYRGRKVTLRTRKGSAPTLYADLRIEVPASGRLELRNSVGAVAGGDLEGDLVVDTGSGDVDLRSFSGTLVVDTGSGDVSLGVARGETTVDTGSGDIRIAELVGNASLDTGSGDISVRKVSLGRLVADTGSGNVQVENGSVGELKADTGSGDIQIVDVDVVHLVADTGSGEVVFQSTLASAEDAKISTGSGDVRILATAEPAFDLSFDAGSGDLVVRYDDAQLRRSGREVVGAVRGAGGAKIRVDTGSGDCVIGPA